MAVLVALLAFAPTFDAFDGPLDPARWYIGVAKPPQKGVLRIDKGGWIVSRHVPDDQITELRVDFRCRGGQLEVAFFSFKQPLHDPQGEVLLLPKGKSAQVLVIDKGGAKLDGKELAWKGALLGTFRLRAVKGAVEVGAVQVDPRVAEPPALDRRTVFQATTPTRHDSFSRSVLTLWDTEVCFLFRRGKESSFERLAAPVRGAPTLGLIVRIGDGKKLALAASTHALARRDWGDESRNLSRQRYLDYLAREYRTFEAIMMGQRALNAALPHRKDLEALVHLAVIRHTANAYAAVALAETQGNKAALAALRKALGSSDWRHTSADRLRRAAGEAARRILGREPPEWPGFSFDPTSRYVTVDQARELAGE